jgi:hypothetical protein
MAFGDMSPDAILRDWWLAVKGQVRDYRLDGPRIDKSGESTAQKKVSTASPLKKEVDYLKYGDNQEQNRDAPSISFRRSRLCGKEKYS